MAKLKVKITIFVNHVAFQILKQDNSLTSSGIKPKQRFINGLYIESLNKPALGNDYINLRGSQREHDFDVVLYYTLQPRDYRDLLIKSLKEFAEGGYFDGKTVEVKQEGDEYEF
jgi:hypothetical protein